MKKLSTVFLWVAMIGLVLINTNCAHIPSQKPVKLSNKITPPERKNIPGERFSLSTGKMFIPDYYKAPKDGKFDLVVFFHGAAWCSEQVFYEGRKNAVLVSISLSDYQGYFEDTTRFQKILDEIVLTLDTTGIIHNPSIDRICISSFSGGYSAPREILKTPAYYNRINDMILADSLYCSFTDTTRRHLNEEQMAPFLHFAQDAAKGEKYFWFTQLYPPEKKYRDNTTTKTATYLIEHLHGKRVSRYQVNKLGMTLLYSFETGNCHILGYAGMTNQDHFNHLYNLGEYYSKLPFETIP